MAQECIGVYAPLMASSNSIDPPTGFDPFPGPLADRRAVVMGLGGFGGGEAVARHLRNAGASVLVTDLRPAEALEHALEGLQDLEIEFHLGEHLPEDFTSAEIVVVNPAVPHPWDNPFLELARKAGARMLTEIRLAIGDHPADRVIGVTGSAGKSTTSAMIHHALSRVRPDLTPRLGGNIGGSLLEDPPLKNATVILELSSFMLHWLAGDGGDPADRFTPGIAVITNISPNHLDWHTSIEHYTDSKNAILRPSPACEQPRPVPVSDPDVDDTIADALELAIPGAHNRSNALLAIRTILAHLELVEGPIRDRRRIALDCAAALADFGGLPHRLEFIGEIRGVRFFNDSKSTTPEASVLAVESMEDRARVHLIAGGYDKGSDLEPIARLAPSLGGLFGIGSTSESVCRGGGEACGTLEIAVERCMRQADAGDIVLLSPGCASWDQFANYEDRGNAFRRLVESAR